MHAVTLMGSPCLGLMQVIAILASGSKLPFEVTSTKLDLPELQVCPHLDVHTLRLLL